MRTASIAFLFALAFVAAPAAAKAVCPAYQAALALQDAALPAGADVHKLTGAAAQGYVDRLQTAVDKAATCVLSGSTGDRATALTTISQIRYIQAWVLTHDGVVSDRAKAIEIAKASKKAIDAFRSGTDLSSQASADLDNWSYWNGLMIDHPDQACLGC